MTSKTEQENGNMEHGQVMAGVGGAGTGFQALPNELVMWIGLLLPSSMELRAFAQTCKRFYAVAKDPYFLVRRLRLIYGEAEAEELLGDPPKEVLTSFLWGHALHHPRTTLCQKHYHWCVVGACACGQQIYGLRYEVQRYHGWRARHPLRLTGSERKAIARLRQRRVAEWFEAHPMVDGETEKCVRGYLDSAGSAASLRTAGEVARLSALSGEVLRVPDGSAVVAAHVAGALRQAYEAHLVRAGSDAAAVVELGGASALLPPLCVRDMFLPEAVVRAGDAHVRGLGAWVAFLGRAWECVVLRARLGEALAAVERAAWKHQLAMWLWLLGSRVVASAVVSGDEAALADAVAMVRGVVGHGWRRWPLQFSAKHNLCAPEWRREDDRVDGVAPRWAQMSAALVGRAVDLLQQLGGRLSASVRAACAAAGTWAEAQEIIACGDGTLVALERILAAIQAWRAVAVGMPDTREMARLPCTRVCTLDAALFRTPCHGPLVAEDGAGVCGDCCETLPEVLMAPKGKGQGKGQGQGKGKGRKRKGKAEGRLCVACVLRRGDKARRVPRTAHTALVWRLQRTLLHRLQTLVSAVAQPVVDLTRHRMGLELGVQGVAAAVEVASAMDVGEMQALVDRVACVAQAATTASVAPGAKTAAVVGNAVCACASEWTE